MGTASTTPSRSGAPGRNRRLNTGDYLDEAIDILGEHGVAGLTTTRLCERLGVTRGSLYHHFDSGPALHDAVVRHWEEVLVPMGLDAIEAIEPTERIDLLHQLALVIDPRAENAIRAWANTNPTVAAALRRVDRAREDTLTRAFVDVGIPARRATTLARIGFSLLVGAVELDEELDHDRFAAVLAEYRIWIDHCRTEATTAPPSEPTARAVAASPSTVAPDTDPVSDDLEGNPT